MGAERTKRLEQLLKTVASVYGVYTGRLQSIYGVYMGCIRGQLLNQVSYPTALHCTIFMGQDVNQQTHSMLKNNST